jgi:integrase
VIEGRNGTTVRVRRYDTTKPTKGWRTAWRKLTEKAGLKGLRGHDLRHSCEKAARKASEALSRVKAEQRAEARAKMREQARVDSNLVNADAIPTNVASVQGAVVH